MEKLHKIAARSYKNLIERGIKTIKDVPDQALPYLQELAPELFKEGA